MVGRKYKNPPIVEAVCEFRLTPNTPWDLTVPGLFYEKVKNNFPKREQRVFQEVELAQETQGLRHQIRTSERILLFTPNRKMLIQIGPRLLTVNALKPYPSWQVFRAQIEMAWETIQGIIEIRGIQRIGLRYINRIELREKEPVELKDYFEFYPFIGSRLPQNTVSFIVGSQFSYEADRDRCRVQLTPAPGSGGDNPSFILDIDYFLSRPLAIEVSDALHWVEEAHTRVEDVFEGCIKNRLRELFEEVQ